MRLTHNTVVLDFAGVQQVDSSGNPITFRDLAMMALTAETNQPMLAEKKARIFALCTKFFKGKTIDITVEEAALLKERGGEVLTTIGYGRLSEWLENSAPFIATDDDEEVLEQAGEALNDAAISPEVSE